MIRLIVTTDSDLYERLAKRAGFEGDTPQRVTNVMSVFKQITIYPVGMVVVDMSLHAADTLLEVAQSRGERRYSLGGSNRRWVAAF